MVNDEVMQEAKHFILQEGQAYFYNEEIRSLKTFTFSKQHYDLEPNLLTRGAQYLSVDVPSNMAFLLMRIIFRKSHVARLLMAHFHSKVYLICLRKCSEV